MNTPPPRLEREYSTLLAYIPTLQGYAKRLYRGHIDADDLVQETLVRAMAHMDQYEPGTRMKSWLFCIMRNTFYTEMKNARREGPGSDECVMESRSVEAGQEWSLRAHEFETALSKLPTDQQKVLVEVAMLGMSYERAASIFGCEVGTIKSRLSRARAALFYELGEDPKQNTMARSEQISRHVLREQPPF